MEAAIEQCSILIMCVSDEHIRSKMGQAQLFAALNHSLHVIAVVMPNYTVWPPSLKDGCWYIHTHSLSLTHKHVLSLFKQDNTRSLFPLCRCLSQCLSLSLYLSAHLTLYFSLSLLPFSISLSLSLSLPRARALPHSLLLSLSLSLSSSFSLPFSLSFLSFLSFFVSFFVSFFLSLSHVNDTLFLVTMRGGGLGSRPKKMYGERLGDGVEYHLMKPTPRR